MKYSIFVSLLVYFILFPDDVKAIFTKEACIECCNGLPENKHLCIMGCNQKFSMSQEYNSRRECNHSCLKRLSGCKKVCLDDCESRFEFIEPGKKILSRHQKKGLRKRLIFESAGLPVYKTSTPNPLSKKPRKPRKKRRIEESSSTNQ